MRKPRHMRPRRRRAWDASEEVWKRCGSCGAIVKVPPQPLGHACKKCGAPLSWARDC